MPNMSQQNQEWTPETLRAFVTEEAKQWEAGKIKAPCHFCGGNEEQLIDIFREIKRHDYVFSGHRNSYHALLHGVDPNDLMCEICGGEEAYCKGRARSMGFIHHKHKFYSSAIVGGCVNIAVGVAVALKQQWTIDPLSPDEVSSQRRVWAFIGDGAVDGGHFWEALQYAQGWDLPLTFVIEDNDRSTCTSKKARNGLKEMIILGADKVKHYNYTPTYPHVGTGKYIQF